MVSELMLKHSFISPSSVIVDIPPNIGESVNAQGFAPSLAGVAQIPVLENNAKKNCLLITQRFPYPPDRGDRIRSYQILRFLSRRSRVWLACTSDEDPTSDQIAHVRQLCDGEVSVHRIGRRGRLISAASQMAFQRSATQGAFYSRSMYRTLARWTRSHKMDAVLTYCSSMGPYLKALHQRPPKVVLDLVDLDSQKWRDYADACGGFKRWLYRLEARRVHQLEKRLAGASDHVVLVSQQEAELFQHHHNGRSADALCNGVDTEYFAPGVIPADCVAVHRRGQPQFVFVGVLNYQPNTSGIIWFCKTIWPAIRHLWPAAHLDIVGRSPTTDVLSLGTIAGVQVVGSVADVRPYLLAADVAVAPLQIARGVQNKVLEALASSLPVIATPQAATGVAPSPGLVTATAPEQWLEAIRTFTATPDHHHRIGQAARHHVQQHYSWEAKLQPLTAYLGLMA
jgi:polysaccharide biosynthesis protein PslH